MASLCILVGLAACLARLDRRCQWCRRHGSRDQDVPMLEMDISDDVQIVVVKRRDSRFIQGSPKSALSSPERNGSLGKSVRWADEIADSCDIGHKTTHGLLELLH